MLDGRIYDDDRRRRRRHRCCNDACGVVLDSQYTKYTTHIVHIPGRNRVCMCPRVYALLTDPSVTQRASQRAAAACA